MCVFKNKVNRKEVFDKRENNVRLQLQTRTTSFLFYITNTSLLSTVFVPNIYTPLIMYIVLPPGNHAPFIYFNYTCNNKMMCYIYNYCIQQ